MAESRPGFYWPAWQKFFSHFAETGVGAGYARPVHHIPLKHDPNHSSEANMDRAKDGAGGRNRTDTPCGTGF